jgi:hypothetical protein
VKKLIAFLLIVAIAPPAFAQFNIYVDPDSVARAREADTSATAGFSWVSSTCTTATTATHALTADSSATDFFCDGALRVKENEPVSFWGEADDSTGKFFWFPESLALRVGRPTDVFWYYWHPDSLGYASVSFGVGNIATGQHAFAAGANNQARGIRSTALGNSGLASGFATLTVGCDNTASGSHSMALGNWNTASANRAFAAAEHCTASGVAAVAMGFYNNAEGLASAAFLRNANALGNYALAMGRNVTASANNSITMGSGLSEAKPLINSSASSFMIGFGDTLPTFFVDNDHSVGIGTILPEERLHVVGNVEIDSSLNVDETVTASQFIGDATHADTAEIWESADTKADTSWINDEFVVTGNEWDLKGHSNWILAQGGGYVFPDTIELLSVHVITNVNGATAEWIVRLAVYDGSLTTRYESDILETEGWKVCDTTWASPIEVP